MAKRFINNKKSYYLPLSEIIDFLNPPLELHSSFSKTLKDYILEGSYIDFVSNKSEKSNEFNHDCLIFYVFSLNQKIGISMINVLEYENFNISDYKLISKEMALELFVDSDINIINNKDFIYNYDGLYNSLDNENSSCSLNSLSSFDSLSNISLHKIKMNSGLDNNSRIYCYFNSAIHMFIHDINIRNAIKSFDENSYIDFKSPDDELNKYQLMDYFKQLIIITESKNCINNTKSDLLKKIRDLLISKITSRFNNLIHGQEDSNEVYNIIFSFLKSNSNLIPDNLLINALNLYGTNVCTMKSLVCKIANCNGLKNRYLKNDIIDNMYDDNMIYKFI